MHLPRRNLFALPILVLIGCASPGPPRSPSLHVPQPVSDLSALRVADTVTLTYTLPSTSTDRQPLHKPKARPETLHGVLCREVQHSACVAIQGITEPLTGDSQHLRLTDPLPSALLGGPPRLLAYRIEFFAPNGTSAGKSNPAFTASGPAPAPVAGFTAQGSREGIVLAWSAAPAVSGDVLLRRTRLQPSAPQAEVWLNAHASTTAHTLDTTVTDDQPYTYVAYRRLALTLSGQTVELRSQPSAALEITLHPIYPPAAPTGLAAAAFAPLDDPNRFAVDLVWQPVEDNVPAQIAPPFVGYNVYRQPLTGTGPVIRLNAAPLPLPGFHDTTASPGTSYRYTVTATDTAGNQSAADGFTFVPRGP